MDDEERRAPMGERKYTNRRGTEPGRREEDEEDFVERRVSHGRRIEDYAPVEAKADNLKFSVRDIGFIVAALFTLGGSFLAFNSKIENAQNENILKIELITTRVVSLEQKSDKFEKKIDDIRDRLDDIERTTTQIYQTLRSSDGRDGIPKKRKGD